MSRTIIIAFAISWLAGCGPGTRRNDVAHVVRDSQRGYEIRLDASVRVFGGPCNPSILPTWVKESHWIYTRKLEGTVPANDLVLTYERGKTDYPWPQSALKGAVAFSPGHVHVALERPYYLQNGSIDHFEPYPLNGSYVLQTR